MPLKPARLRAIYRSLLRELPPRPILSSPRSPIHANLRTTFGAAPSPSSSSSPSKAGTASPDSQAAQAEQFIVYLRAQRKYVALLERYNPGMDLDDAERVRLTARRVGMDLPVEYATSKS